MCRAVRFRARVLVLNLARSYFLVTANVPSVWLSVFPPRPPLCPPAFLDDGGCQPFSPFPRP